MRNMMHSCLGKSVKEEWFQCDLIANASYGKQIDCTIKSKRGLEYKYDLKLTSSSVPPPAARSSLFQYWKLRISATLVFYAEINVKTAQQIIRLTYSTCPSS